MPDLNKAYTWAIQTCNATSVGYSQDYRNQLTVNGITYYDCSSFINYAIVAGGWVTPNYAPHHNAFTTGTMMPVLRQLGWNEVPANGVILPGDIGVTDSSNGHHTEMCYSQGVGHAVFMGAHGQSGRTLQQQVSIGDVHNGVYDPNYTRSFEHIFRWGSGDASGYTSYLPVISALAGNAWRESHIDPTLEEQGGGGGWGIFQWTGTRRTLFETWCTQSGYSFTDPYAQLQYISVEGADPDIGAWSGTFGGISSVNEFLTSTSTDVDMLTEAWMRCWERPQVEELQERIDFAHEAYNYIQTHAQDASIIEWYTSSTLLTREQALHNAVLMYRYLSAGGGGGGAFGEAKKMPVWMKINYRI